MNQAEAALLCDIIRSGDTIRPLGDVVPAKGLQSAGMATLTYLDEGHRICVRPTDQGRRWYALAVAKKQRSGAMGKEIDNRAARLAGGAA